jgi:hypothetical protein
MTEQLIYVIIELGVLALSITAIWVLLSRFNKSLDSKIGQTVEPLIDKSEKRMEKLMEEKDESSNKDVLFALKELNKSFEAYTKRQDIYNANDVKRFNMVERSLVESYKKQIRNIYYNLANTGVIKDEEWSYIQKIFPYYKAMGGNSDIEAKYEEMNKVISDITQEKFKVARENAEQERIARERANSTDQN